MALVPATTIFAIVTVTLVVVALNVKLLQAVALEAAVALVLYTFCGLALGFFVSKLFCVCRAEKGKAMTFVVGVRIRPLAVALAVQYFDPVAALPGAIGVVWTTICCSFIASVWAGRDTKAGGMGQ